MACVPCFLLVLSMTVAAAAAAAAPCGRRAAAQCVVRAAVRQPAEQHRILLAGPRQLCSRVACECASEVIHCSRSSRVVPDLVLCARRRNHSRFQPVFSSPLGSLRQPRLLYLGSSFSSFSFPHAFLTRLGRHTFLFLSSCGEVVNYHKAVQRTAFNGGGRQRAQVRVCLGG